MRELVGFWETPDPHLKEQGGEECPGVLGSSEVTSCSLKISDWAIQGGFREEVASHVEREGLMGHGHLGPSRPWGRV